MHSSCVPARRNYAIWIVGVCGAEVVGSTPTASTNISQTISRYYSHEKVMHNPPSDRCGVCLWWHKGAIMCIDCPTYPEAERYILPCSQCKQFLFVSQLYEIIFDKKGLFLFCSKECKDKWTFDVAPDKDFSNLESSLT